MRAFLLVTRNLSLKDNEKLSYYVINFDPAHFEASPRLMGSVQVNGKRSFQNWGKEKYKGFSHFSSQLGISAMTSTNGPIKQLIFVTPWLFNATWDSQMPLYASNKQQQVGDAQRGVTGGLGCVCMCIYVILFPFIGITAGVCEASEQAS